MLPFQRNSFLNKFLAIVEGGHSQLNTQLIIKILQELLMPGCINTEIIRSIACKLVKLLHILSQCASSLAQAAKLLLLQAHGLCRHMCDAKSSLKPRPG